MKDGEIVKMTVGPKPYQKPHPPIRLLMSSEPSFTEAAELGLDGWVWIEPPKWLRQRLQLYADIRTSREERQFRLGENVGALRMVLCGTELRGSKKGHRSNLYSALRIGISFTPSELLVGRGRRGD